MQQEWDKDIPEAMHIILDRHRVKEFATKLKKRQGNSIFLGVSVMLLLSVANATKLKGKKQGQDLGCHFSWCVISGSSNRNVDGWRLFQILGYFFFNCFLLLSLINHCYSSLLLLCKILEMNLLVWLFNSQCIHTAFSSTFNDAAMANVQFV